jgi:hypothetical protein
VPVQLLEQVPEQLVALRGQQRHEPQHLPAGRVPNGQWPAGAVTAHASVMWALNERR